MTLIELIPRLHPVAQCFAVAAVAVIICAIIWGLVTVNIHR